MKIIESNRELEAGGFPERITLELTNNCNLNCIFCPRRIMAKHQGFLNINLANRLNDDIADHLV